MTKEIIYNVEEFIRSLETPHPLKSIRTFQNPDKDIRAPKFLTEVIYDTPMGDHVIVKSTLKIARLLTSKAKYEGKR